MNSFVILDKAVFDFTVFFSFLAHATFCFLTCVIRSTNSLSVSKNDYFDMVDFSKCCSKEVISSLMPSVFLLFWQCVFSFYLIAQS